MRRIKVIANKTWEADPLIDAMLNYKFKPRDLPYPIYVNQPPLTTCGVFHMPRLIYEFGGDIVEVWCIEDQMNPKVSGSSTHEKVRLLPEILLKSGEPDLVIAFGTAGSPEPNENGGVSCGASFYLHDGQDPKNPDPWDGAIEGENYVGRLLESDVPDEVFGLFTEENLATIRRLFLSVPLSPASNPDFNCSKNNLGVGDINIIDYGLYKTEDLKSIDDAKAKVPEDKKIASVETTHGVIAASTVAYTKSPTLFISAISDQVGKFDEQVSPKPEAQNFTAAFNGGIVTAWILPKLIEFLRNHN